MGFALIFIYYPFLIPFLILQFQPLQSLLFYLFKRIKIDRPTLSPFSSTFQIGCVSSCVLFLFAPFSQLLCNTHTHTNTHAHTHIHNPLTRTSIAGTFFFFVFPHACGFFFYFIWRVLPNNMKLCFFLNDCGHLKNKIVLYEKGNG